VELYLHPIRLRDTGTTLPYLPTAKCVRSLSAVAISVKINT
jgi:hypothetical protein